MLRGKGNFARPLVLGTYILKNLVCLWITESYHSVTRIHGCEHLPTVCLNAALLLTLQKKIRKPVAVPPICLLLLPLGPWEKWSSIRPFVPCLQRSGWANHEEDQPPWLELMANQSHGVLWIQATSLVDQSFTKVISPIWIVVKITYKNHQIA